MDLRIRLTEEPEEIWIDNTHEVFKGTSYETDDFKVKIKLLTKNAYSALMRQCMKKSGIDHVELTSKVFLQCVLDWTIADEEGKKIPCNAKNKAMIDNIYPLLSGSIAAACFKDPEALKEESELEIKN